MKNSIETNCRQGVTLRFLAPEWYPQSAIQLTWPHSDTDWAYMLDEVTECYLSMAYEISLRTRLLVVAPEVENVKKLLSEKLPLHCNERISYFECPTNDTWARDHAFLSVVGEGGLELYDYRFNGWGGKFSAKLDNAINRRLFETGVLNGRYVSCLDFELEGGSVETDGNGTLLTTSQCLLNPNRNPTFTKAEIERKLTADLGVERFLWLDYGYLAGDDTDSHIDTLARLCPNDTILYVKCSNQNDEHFEALSMMEQQLLTFRTKGGNPYRLLPLPLPKPIFDGEERLPATYANYLVMDSALLYPTYAQEDLDEEARIVIQKAFPNHEIVGVDCRALIRQHGSLHCATMQFPQNALLDDMV